MLTFLLKNDPSIRQFFETSFPATSSFVARFNAEVAEHRLRFHSDLSIDEAGIVGMAFDYRARMMLQSFEVQSTRAADGARALASQLRQRSQRDPRSVLDAFLSAIESAVKAIAPERRALTAEEERKVAACCTALALLEGHYRDGRESVLLCALRDGADVVALKKAVNHHRAAIDDLVKLSAFLYDDLREHLDQRIVLNPVFSIAPGVPKADGDVILGGTLFDIKSSRQRAPIRDLEVWQLLGYALLDREDAHAIKSVGFYLPRRGIVKSWDLDELLRALSEQERALTAWREAAAARFAAARREAAGARLTAARRSSPIAHYFNESEAGPERALAAEAPAISHPSSMSRPVLILEPGRSAATSDQLFASLGTLFDTSTLAKQVASAIVELRDDLDAAKVAVFTAAASANIPVEDMAAIEEQLAKALAEITAVLFAWVPSISARDESLVHGAMHNNHDPQPVVHRVVVAVDNVDELASAISPLSSLLARFFVLASRVGTEQAEIQKLKTKLATLEDHLRGHEGQLALLARERATAPEHPGSHDRSLSTIDAQLRRALGAAEAMGAKLEQKREALTARRATLASLIRSFWSKTDQDTPSDVRAETVPRLARLLNELASFERSAEYLARDPVREQKAERRARLKRLGRVARVAGIGAAAIAILVLRSLIPKPDLWEPPTWQDVAIHQVFQGNHEDESEGFPTGLRDAVTGAAPPQLDRILEQLPAHPLKIRVRTPVEPVRIVLTREAVAALRAAYGNDAAPGLALGTHLATDAPKTLEGEGPGFEIQRDELCDGQHFAVIQVKLRLAPTARPVVRKGSEIRMALRILLRELGVSTGLCSPLAPSVRHGKRKPK